MSEDLFSPRLALASLSGCSDANWAIAGSRHAGAAFLGGIALDDPARIAAKSLVERGRDEFLPPDPIGFVEAQLSRLESVAIRPGINVRSTSREPIADVARCCVRTEGLLEINAHCRQEELCAVGCGETLLADTDRLGSFVETAVEVGAVTGVKVRAEVPGVDLVETARRIETAGATFVHVDAMDSRQVVADVVDTTDLFVIANNGVRTATDVEEYRSYGAHAVSLGRPSDDPIARERVRRALGESVRESVDEPGGESVDESVDSSAERSSAE